MARLKHLGLYRGHGSIKTLGLYRGHGSVQLFDVQGYILCEFLHGQLVVQHHHGAGERVVPHLVRAPDPRRIRPRVGQKWYI